MTGIDKILSDIREEAEKNVAGILGEAKEKAAAITGEAQKTVDAKEEAFLAKIAGNAADRKARSESAAALKSRQRVLEKKQELIGKAMEEALSKAQGLPDDKYFSVILGMAAKAAHSGEGEIAFSEKDLKRLPASFEKDLNEKLSNGAKLSVAKEPVQTDSGFVLRYEGIEENCSFGAILAARKEELQDKVRGVLFGDR